MLKGLWEILKPLVLIVVVAVGLSASVYGVYNEMFGKKEGLKGIATPRAALVNVFGTSTNDETLATSSDPVIFTMEIGEGVDVVRTNISYLASSTLSKIEFSVGYSWDGTNFFGEAAGFNNNTTSVDTLVLNTATSSYIVTAGGTEREYRSFEIPTNGARFLRYSIGRAGGAALGAANAEIWVQAALIDNR